MTNYNQYPGTSEKETFAHQEGVQYNDGEVALAFRTPGDVLHLGYDSTFKYARHVHTVGGDVVIVRTKSGNAYGIGNGIVVNNNLRRAYRLPDELPDITVGQQWDIPGVGRTSDVVDVQFRYKTAPEGYGEVQVDTPSPFPALRRELFFARDQFDAQQD